MPDVIVLTLETPTYFGIYFFYNIIKGKQALTTSLLVDLFVPLWGGWVA